MSAGYKSTDDSAMNWADLSDEEKEREAARWPADQADERCDHCGEGDPVPAKGYWKCPVCDAEWNVDEDDEA